MLLPKCSKAVVRLPWSFQQTVTRHYQHQQQYQIGNFWLGIIITKSQIIQISAIKLSIKARQWLDSGPIKMFNAPSSNSPSSSSSSFPSSLETQFESSDPATSSVFLSSSLILKARVVLTDVNFLLPGVALLQGFEITKVPDSSEEIRWWGWVSFTATLQLRDIIVNCTTHTFKHFLRTIVLYYISNSPFLCLW